MGTTDNPTSDKQPRRPSHLSVYAETCLRALAERGLGDKVSLGGALGLLHYLDYRPTQDADAWWTSEADADARNQVIEVVRATLATYGQTHVRAWGDVVSIELTQVGRTVFSFQIARRSALLEPSSSAPWADILLDSLSDLVASKMAALVERGAPRDFRDIYEVCQIRLMDPHQCWDLWRRRQELARSDTDTGRARLALVTHLARIAGHRPLSAIEDPVERTHADNVRKWFSGEFLDALD